MSEESEGKDQGEREGEDTEGLSLSSGTHRIHLGYGEVAGEHATLLTDTRRRVVSLTENAGRMILLHQNKKKARAREKMSR